MLHLMFLSQSVPLASDVAYTRLKIFEPLVNDDPHSLVPSGFKIRATFNESLHEVLQRITYISTRHAQYTFCEHLPEKNLLTVIPEELGVDALRIERFDDFEGAAVYGISSGDHVHASLNPRGYTSRVVYSGNTIADLLNASKGEEDFFHFIRPQINARGFPIF